MELEKQVTSLDLSKRLKELGVKQESLFWWAEYRHGHLHPDWKWQVTDSLYEGDYDHYRNAVSAFTVAELGEMLPASRALSGNRWFEYWKYDDAWGIQLQTQVRDAMQTLWSVLEPTEADARAKMLIYLLENKLITL